MKFKKGEIDTLKSLIIMIIVLSLIAGVVLLKALPFMKEKQKQESCTSSIMYADASADMSRGFGSKRITCTSKRIEISEHDITDNRNNLDRDKIFRKIAHQIYACKVTIGNFDLFPFSDWEGEEKKFGLLCSRFDFSDEAVEKIGDDKLKVAELMLYMATNNLPTQKFTFFQHLYGREATEDEITYFEEQIDTSLQYINVSQDYVVLWHLDYTGNSLLGIILRLGNPIGGISMFFRPISRRWRDLAANGNLTGVDLTEPIEEAGGIIAGTALQVGRQNALAYSSIQFIPIEMIQEKIETPDGNKDYFDVLLN